MLKRGGRLAVLGGGESGTGAAILGKKEGYEVFVSDQGPIKEAYKEVLIQTGIDWEEGGHTVARLLKADLCVKSPGIPDTIPLLVQMREQCLAHGPITHAVCEFYKCGLRPVVAATDHMMGDGTHAIDVNATSFADSVSKPAWEWHCSSTTTIGRNLARHGSKPMPTRRT